MDYPVVIEEAVILAGGLGTRLQGVVSALPKPMAPVAGQPFLTYLLDLLKKHQVKKVVLSVGHKWESIAAYFGNQFQGMDLIYAVEKEPLGTGGGILQAVKHIQSQDFLLLNGDSIFDVNLSDLSRFHHQQKADITLSLKWMTQFDRYGSVTLVNKQINAFKEKQWLEEGWINAGVYAINKHFLTGLALPEKCSFEKDVLEKYVHTHCFMGYESDGYFIDIGIPEDYFRAQEELKK